MRIYNIPIKCTPQISIIPVGARILTVTEPRRFGQLYMPMLVVSCPESVYRNAIVDGEVIGQTNGVSTELFYNATITCVRTDCTKSSSTHEFENSYNNTLYATSSARSIVSLIQNHDAPTAIQESRMRSIGNYTDVYDKFRYEVFVEDLTAEGPSLITPTSASGRSRAISEGSLTRTIN